MIQERRWHAMWAIIPNFLYRCHACGFRGSLAAAIAHVIENQERV